MKKTLILFSIISIIIFSVSCKPEVKTNPTKEEPDRISSLRIPFDITELDNYNAPLEFSDGDWEIVDINEDSGCIYKIITKVSYANGNYTCTSMTMKLDLPRGDETEETIDYEECYSLFVDNFMNSNLKNFCTFSHGLLTDKSIVLIIEFDTQIFEQVYLSQLNGIQESKVLSNYAKTKYMIDRSTDSYQETIFIYKLGNKASSSEFADCTIACSSSDFDLSEGDWLDRKVENQPNGKLESFYVLSVTADGTITKRLNYTILTMDLQAMSQISGMSDINDWSDIEKLNFIKAYYNSSEDPDNPSCISVLVDKKNIICAFQDAVDSSIYSADDFLLNNASSIKTNSSKTKYIVKGSFENSAGATIKDTLYLHKVN